MKINVFGASGAGTTTLGKALADRYNSRFLDADDYYWQKTEPPFQYKVPLAERSKGLLRDLQSADAAVLSGSMTTWGEEWLEAFDLGVFLYIPPEVRMQRLQKREIERYGKQLQSDSTIAKTSKDFLAWARKYDAPNFEGRSITQHKDWIKIVRFPVLKIEGDFSVAELIEKLNDKVTELKT
ncbi:MAG: AAA family ATPase [Bacteroidia bacterium]